MHLLIHIETYDRDGILPSQLNSLRTTAEAAGFERLAFVDCTLDGFFEASWERFVSLDQFLAAESDDLVVLETQDIPLSEGLFTINIEDMHPDMNTWLVIGPAMGLRPGHFNREVMWCYIPMQLGGGRDAAPVALWELRS